MDASHHRCEFIAYLERLIVAIGFGRDGKRTGRVSFRSKKGGTIHFRLRFRGKLLRLNSGETALIAKTLDDLIAQLEQLKEIAAIGGLDSILDAAMNSAE